MNSKNSKTDIRIYLAAERLFLRFGYSRTSISHICSTAGVSRPFFYKHFRDKQELLARLLFQVAREGVTGWQNSLRNAPSLEQRIAKFCRSYLEFCHDHPILVRPQTDSEMASALGAGKYTVHPYPILECWYDDVVQNDADRLFRGTSPSSAAWITLTLLDGIFRSGTADSDLFAAMENTLIRGLVDHLAGR